MRILTALLLASTLAAVPAAASDSPIAGVWTATLHDQPCIKLTVIDNGGKLSGSIIFYMLMLEDGSWRVKGDAAVDLINPRLEGQTFVFEVPHAKKHGSTDPADQEIKAFRLELTGKNEAVFKNATEAGDLTLRRKTD
jgi:hypothetical protein